MISEHQRQQLSAAAIYREQQIEAAERESQYRERERLIERDRLHHHQQQQVKEIRDDQERREQHSRLMLDPSATFYLERERMDRERPHL